jgi:KipI family sensor histidine kinase inhibitor
MAVKTHLEKLLLQPRTVGRSQQSSWRIPACYESDLAPDLAAVAARTGVTPQNYADLHAQQSYMVYMVGGFPGYPHMGDLPDRLRVPRLDSPRTRVPPGSICVAGQLTAIYPMPTPGGWNLIGRTPVRIFDATLDPPALLSPGDIVRFRSISRQEFDRIERDVSAGAWDYASLRSAGSCDPG